ncbi:MAG TPA: cytochrome c, partial [Candidatus Acidoferrales bacterium]|nr:cytochrome c [Candidatus Acidoferrales bacterium]
MKDWREAGALAGLSDSDLFDIIAKGKGKMVGEGDRVPPEKIWSLVNYVKSFAKKDGVEKASGETPKS